MKQIQDSLLERYKARQVKKLAIGGWMRQDWTGTKKPMSVEDQQLNGIDVTTNFNSYGTNGPTPVAASTQPTREFTDGFGDSMTVGEEGSGLTTKQGSSLMAGVVNVGTGAIMAANKKNNNPNSKYTNAGYYKTQGAASSAMSGASMGASFGPIGIAAGAVIGGVAGYALGAKKDKQAARDFSADQAEFRKMRSIERDGRSAQQGLFQNGSASQYYKNGGKLNEPKVYTDRKQFEQAQRMYNDSLKTFNLANLEQKNYYNGKSGVPVPFSKNPQFNSANEFIDSHYGEYTGNSYNSAKELNTVAKRARIKPYGQYTPPPNTGGLGDQYPAYFKKPVQPVVYQSHPIQKMSRINPQQMDLNSQVNIQGQQVPMPKMKLPQQRGNPVYGPGNTIVGYSDNMNFKPAYEYTGASNNQLNLQDKALLADPDALKKYAKSKDNYRFKDEEFGKGGSLLDGFKRTSSSTAEVHGPSHEQGGVQVPGMPGVEVEGKETLAGDYVFSDELGFAKLHKPIARAKGKVEKKPATRERLNTLKLLNEKENNLKLMQEYVKSKNNLQ